MEKWCLRGARFGARIMKQQVDYDYSFRSYEFIVMRIPAGTITEEDLLNFKQRKDKPNMLTLRIQTESFVDKRSGFDFSEFVTVIIPYEE